MPLFNVSVYTKMSDKQFNELKQEIKAMAVNVDALMAAVADVQADVQNVIRKLNEPDVDAQAKIDAATDALRAVNAALDAVAPDATEPTPE